MADPPSPPQPIQTTTATTPPDPRLVQEIISRAAWKQAVMGSINVAVAILAARMILGLAVIGSIGLSWLALSQADPYHLIAVAVYSVTVVLPLVWLAGRH